MALISIDEAKAYLRVDSSDEDGLIGGLLFSAEKSCADVARLTDEQWKAVNSVKTDEDGNVLPTNTDLFTEEELAQVRAIMKTAILYTVGYLFEHREEADHHELVMTLRNLLFSLREGVF